ncbi:hypothetical protein Celaphus_00009740 [Cervus elaphus hippelaphus]|uniref:Uncharacterized protein n=1 Tax=Cervus elaphus hippelaphus TaxID=46360 RepID=A0A212C126_CEREH|nr:hypothetical protein Celaphus_00009740 [Cervus elaphus hippelaphus]
MQPSRDQELTLAKILKALTAVLRSPLGTNSIALCTAVRLTQARRRRRKSPQIRAGLSAFWALHNCKPGGKEQIAPALPASWSCFDCSLIRISSLS